MRKETGCTLSLYRYYVGVLSRFDYRRTKHFGPPKRLFKLRNQIAHGNIEERFRSPDFIAESPNSGIRIGIVIHPQEAGITNMLPMIYASFDILDCNAGIIIRSSSAELQHEEEMIYNLRRIEIRQFFLAITCVDMTAIRTR